MVTSRERQRLETAATVLAAADTLFLTRGFTQTKIREVAEACGVSRVSARRYLDFLSTRGLAQLRPKYGATGRPEHRYLWTG